MRACIALVLAAFAAMPASEAHAHSAGGEAAAKAAFVYNFAKFTAWPAESFATPQSPLVLCVMGPLDAPLARAFESVERKRAQNRPIRTRRAARGDDLKACHILYLPEGEARRAGETLRALAQRPVLTVGDGEGFAEAGGMIALVDAEDRTQFEINLDATQSAGLALSSQLLRLARFVKDSRTRERR